MSKAIKSTQTEHSQVETVDPNFLSQEKQSADHTTQKSPPKEVNGPKGLEPTRYGDWESKGRCYDF